MKKKRKKEKSKNDIFTAMDSYRRVVNKTKQNKNPVKHKIKKKIIELEVRVYGTSIFSHHNLEQNLLYS
jgi:hypothetical protein